MKGFKLIEYSCMDSFVCNSPLMDKSILPIEPNSRCAHHSSEVCVSKENKDLTESDDTIRNYRETTPPRLLVSPNTTIHHLDRNIYCSYPHLNMPPLSTTSILLTPSDSSISSSNMNPPRPSVPPQPRRPPSSSSVSEALPATTPSSDLPKPTRAITPSYPATSYNSTSNLTNQSTSTHPGGTRTNFETLNDDNNLPSGTGSGSHRPRKRIHLDLRDQTKNGDNHKKTGKPSFTSASTLTEGGRANPKRRVIPPPPVDLEGEDASKELITEYNCPICLCPPSEACVTPCGHLMCFACLRNSLLSNPQSTYRQTSQPISAEVNLEGSCPVCRKVLPGGLLGYDPSKGKGKAKGGKKARPGVIKIELKLIDLVKD